MAIDTHATVKTLTDAGADEVLAVAVVEVAREAGTEAAGELVTRSHLTRARADRVPPGHCRHRNRGR